MAPPIHLGAWSMALTLWLPFELLRLEFLDIALVTPCCHILLQTVGDGRGGREGERENSDDVIIDMETPSATADESSFEEITTSPESHVIDHGDHVTNGDDHVTNREDHVTNRGDHVTNRGDHVTNHGDHVTNQGDHVTNCGDHVTGEEELTPVLEGTLILASRRGSDTELEREKGEEPVGGVNLSSSAHWPLSQKKSLPIPITVSYCIYVCIYQTAGTLDGEKILLCYHHLHMVGIQFFVTPKSCFLAKCYVYN